MGSGVNFNLNAFAQASSSMLQQASGQTKEVKVRAFDASKSGFTGASVVFKGGNGAQTEQAADVEKDAQSAVYEKGKQPDGIAGYDKTGKKTGNAAIGIKNSLFSSSAAAKSAALTTSKEYGKIVGEPKLSEEGKKYYDELKSKYGNMDFILVGRDSVEAAKGQIPSYMNPDKMIVLVDEDKIERMATDEEYRKKYESIIEQAANAKKLQGIMDANPNIKKVGVNTLDNGAGSFMAACAKNTQNSTKKLEAKRAEKKELKKAEEKKAAKAKEKKAADEKAKAKRDEKRLDGKDKDIQSRDVIEENDFSKYMDNDDYDIIYADTMDELIEKLEAYNKANGMGQAAEAGVGHIDYRG